MADRRVTALLYRIEHNDTVDYEKAPPLEFEAPDFSVYVRDGTVRFTLKQDVDDLERARAIVEPFIRTWELWAAVERGSGEFTLRYSTAEIVDPLADPHRVSLAATMSFKVSMDAVLHVSRGTFPAPPVGPVFVSADVEVMAERYALFRQRRDTLAAMAYFCLTLLEMGRGRREAAMVYGIDQAVLKKLGELTSTKGGHAARKAHGLAAAYTPQETAWIDAAVKAIIRRASEVAGDPTPALPLIRMADLPSL